jgi:pimeloyl-ACP methyl ester carboxylesterase
MRARRLLLAASAALTVALAGVPQAGAAVVYAPCPKPAGFECGTLDVPLDRTGVRAGRITLRAQRVRAQDNPDRSAVLALAGGPGQAALPLSMAFANVLGPALVNRDLLVFDQRGTGSSNALSCAALRQRASILTVTRRCASQIGPARAFFTSFQTVDDIEDLRRESGYERLVLYGVSYGTKVALNYAERYPQRVEALVLDSVVPSVGQDAFRRSSLQAVPRVLRDLCRGGACRQATPSVTADVRAVARRLSRRPLRGRITDPTGRRRAVSMSETDIMRILLAGDLNPTLRAELPGSLRAALRGDATPLLRLAARSAGLANGAPGLQARVSADSDALFFTTLCEETTFPWNRAADPRTRAGQITAAARRLPVGATGPFSRLVALSAGYAPLCLAWPNAAPAPPGPAALPDVPVLLLEGGADLRTPVEDAGAVARAFPRASLVSVPFTGHSVSSSDLTTCARDVIGRFFAGQPVGVCPAGTNPFSPTTRPPTRLSNVPLLRGATGTRGRTLSAVRVTARDAVRQAIGDAFVLGRLPKSVGGLRGGFARVSQSGVRLVRYEYVPGVRVSGSAPFRGTARLRVASGGGAVGGTVSITQTGRVTARLGGRRVSGRASAAAADRVGDALPSLDRVLALPRLRAR